MNSAQHWPRAGQHIADKDISKLVRKVQAKLNPSEAGALRALLVMRKYPNGQVAERKTNFDPTPRLKELLFHHSQRIKRESEAA